MKLGWQDIVVLICSLALVWTMADPVPAAQRKAREQASPVVSGKPIESLPEQVQQPVRKTDMPAISEGRPEAIQKPTRPAQVKAKPSSSKSRRYGKVHKKVVPKAMVQSRTDLKYHGILENPQRYDPRPNSRTAGLPNPQIPDLIQDHFQELDRNQDGRIDPVEKAFSRLDMDHDLATTQR